MSDKNKKSKQNKTQKQKPVGEVKNVTTTIKGIFELDKKPKSN